MLDELEPTTKGWLEKHCDLDSLDFRCTCVQCVNKGKLNSQCVRHTRGQACPMHVLCMRWQKSKIILHTEVEGIVAYVAVVIVTSHIKRTP